jgi:UDP-glucuronate 4-epimerase
MHVLVTGAAGFIGSHVVERCLADGHTVSAVDNFHPYYARSIKEANVAGFRHDARVRFFELDLARADLAEALDGVTAVVHLAAIAGVRGSWGGSFDAYLGDNVQATQLLLEAVRALPLEVFLYISSASIYGNDAVGAVREDEVPAPHSPYGVTKLAGEHLAHLYRRVHGVPTAALRVFSCYGPRERPDKAIQKFLEAARDGHAIEIYGDGSQQRDFTFVGDTVDGIAAALAVQPIGEAIHLARGKTVPLSEVVETIQRITGTGLVARYGNKEPGDVRVTHACIDKARALLGYDPQVDLPEGIARQWQTVRGAVTGSLISPTTGR